MIQKIVRSGDPVLRKVSNPVAAIDKKILKLIQDLKDTLEVQKDPEGVGLAAPQIDKSLRIFVINYDGVRRVVINPKILQSKKVSGLPRAKAKGEIMEGCLSLPNYYGGIKRDNYVKIGYLDETGKEKVEEFKDFFAQIVLHEIDHLNGIIFIDRLLEQKKPLFELENGEWKEVEI